MILTYIEFIKDLLNCYKDSSKRNYLMSTFVDYLEEKSDLEDRYIIKALHWLIENNKIPNCRHNDFDIYNDEHWKNRKDDDFPDSNIPYDLFKAILERRSLLGIQSIYFDNFYVFCHELGLCL